MTTTTTQSPPVPAPSAGGPDPDADRFPWVPVLALGFAWFLGVAVELSPAGLLGAIAADLHVGVATVGTLTSFYALGNVLLVLPLTGLAIRFARRPVLVTVMAVFTVSNLGVALAPSIAAADVARFAGGASYGVICSLFPAVAVRIAGPRHAAKAVTVIFSATSLGAAFGAPLASIAGNAAGWRVVFLAAAVLAAIAGVLMLATMPRLQATAAKGMSLVTAVRLPGVLRVCLTWSLVMLGHFVVLTYINAYLDHLGVPTWVTSLSLFLLGATGIIGVLLIGRVTARSMSAALVASPALIAVAFVLLALAGAHLAVVLLAVAVWGVGISATIVAYQQAILLTGRRAQETATSIGVLLAQAGFAAGATVGGLTLDHLGVAVIPFIALAFVVGTVALAASLRPTVRRAQQAAREGDLPVVRVTSRGRS